MPHGLNWPAFGWSRVLSKWLQLAPIVITTAGVTALIAFRVEDERLKKTLRMIAIVLFFGSIATVVSEAIKLIEQGAEAQRLIAEQQRRVQEEIAKAAEATARAKSAEEIAKQAALRAEEAERTARLRMEEAERTAKLKAQDLELDARLKAEELERQARIRADRDEQIRREQADRAQREQAIRDEQERRRQQQVRQVELASKTQWCQTCCTRVWEPRLAPNSQQQFIVPCVSYCLKPGPRGIMEDAHCKAQ